MRGIKALSTKFSLALMLLPFQLISADFAEVDTVVQQFDTSTRKNAGMGLTWFMASLPLLLFGAGFFMGFKHAKQKGDQEQSNAKVFITAIVSGIAGAVIGILICMLIGAALLGDASLGVKVVTNFYKNILGV